MCLGVLFMLLAHITYAQNRTVTGKVTDARNGEGLPGASVIVAGTTAGNSGGTTIGTNTSADGSFSISVPTNATSLTVSSVGFSTQEVSIGNSNSVNVSLQFGGQSLDEVVVVGYGTQKRKEVTSAVATVKQEDFNQGGARNPLDLIQGKVAGLAITRTGSSNPNSGVAIQLRGVTSLTGSLSPLIVIDGIPGGNLDLLQQDDIESFDVLKDGSAAAIYGTRANGGVILITTKKGKSGPARFDYSNYFRKEFVTRRPDFLTAAEYRQKIAEGKIPAQYGTGIYGYNSDFFDDLVNHDNLSQYHNLALSGGSASTSYRGSLYYNDFQGIALKNSRQQFGTRLNLNHRGLNDRLTAQVNVVNNFNKANLLGGGGWEDQVNRIPTLSNFDSVGNYFFQPTNTNQYARLFQEKNWRDQQTSSLDAKFSLELIKGLRASIFGSLQRNSWIDNVYADLASERSVEAPVTPAGGGTALPGAFASKSTDLIKDYALEPTIEYTTKIRTNHSISAFAGYSYQYSVTERFNASNSGFFSDVFENNNLNSGNQLAAGRSGIGSTKFDNTLIAFFGRINYSFSDKYMASVILRHEGSSRFGKNHKWGDFPAVSVGWNIIKEDFMSGVDLFSNLKLRAGYGVTGNSGIPNYQSLVTLSTGGQYFYPDGSLAQTYGPSRNPNPDLRWEKKGEFNVGVDFSMLKNRLGGSIDVYQRRTKDLLENYNTQLPAFIQSQIFTNVGTIENKGIELTLNATPVSGKNFTWSTDVTASTQSNKMVKFSNELYKITFKTYGGIGGFGALGDAIRTDEGGKLGNFYGRRFAGFDPNGKWLFYKADGKTQVLAGQIDPTKDRAVIGNGIPKFYASWTNDFTYGNFDLRLFFRGRFGNEILNTMEISYGNKLALPGNVLNSVFEKHAQLNDTYQYSDYYLEPGGFVKLDNVTLGYKVKLNTTYVRNLRVYASGINLITMTKYNGNDPDFVNDTGLGAGVDARGPYPSTRQFTLGLNVGF
jgi:TonB-linked SusC/RagA family outer membrane protein